MPRLITSTASARSELNSCLADLLRAFYQVVVLCESIVSGHMCDTGGELGRETSSVS